MESSLLYGLATLGAGVIALLIRYSFKSKCSDVSLCFGFIRVQRDIEQEVQEENKDNEQGGIRRQSSLEIGNRL
jgi:hypothetical protein